jgi:hypothetical protein
MLRSPLACGYPVEKSSIAEENRESCASNALSSRKAKTHNQAELLTSITSNMDTAAADGD